MHFRNLRTNKSILAKDGFCPTDGVADDKLNRFVMEDREGFVTRLEIEYSSVAAVEGTACAEYLAAFVPAHKYYLVGLGDAKRLCIGFNAVKLEISADALRYRVCGVYRPNALKIAVLAPREVASGSHKRLKDLRMVRRMEADDAHTLQNRFLNAVDYLVGHAVVAHMSPPDKHVGIIENFLSKTAFLVVERCGADGDIVAFKKIRDRLVNTLGVYLLHENLAVKTQWMFWAGIEGVRDGYGIFPHMVITVIAVFIAGVVVDVVRDCIFRSVARL